MGHSVNAITFRLGKSLLWRLLLVNPISLNFFFFNFSRSFLIYYRYINYLFKIKYFKIFYKKGFFFSHLTLRRGVTGKYFLKLYVLDAFFLRLKSRFKVFLLQLFVPYRLNNKLGKFKKKYSAVSRKFVSRKKRGYPTYFFKKLLRSRSNKFNQFRKDSGVSFNGFLARSLFKKYSMFMSGKTRGLFEFFNSGLNFFYFYAKNRSFLNLETFFTKSTAGFLKTKSKLLKSNNFRQNKNFVPRTKKYIFVRSRYGVNKFFPVNPRFFLQVVPSKQRKKRMVFFRRNSYILEKLKKANALKRSFFNFQRNLRLYADSMYQFFGYDIFRVYKQKYIQEILKVVPDIRYRVLKNKNKFTKSNVLFTKQNVGRWEKYQRSRFSNFTNSGNIAKSSKNFTNSSKNNPRGFGRKKLTFFGKVFFFRIKRIFSDFFGSVHLESKNFSNVFRLIFVIFFRKYIRVYYRRSRKFVGSKSTRRFKKSFSFRALFNCISRKFFLKYYFYFLGFFTKLFRLRKVFLFFKYFSKRRGNVYSRDKLFFQIRSLVESLIFFLSVTCFRSLVKKNIKKYVRTLYNQFTFKFVRFLQFKLARLTRCKNLTNLKVQFVPLSCYQGITPDVYINFLRLKIRRRFSFKSLVKPFIKGLKFMQFLRGFYGLGNGRFTRRQRASTVKISRGKIAFSTVSAYLLYSFLPVVTRFGTCGIHIYFNFKKSKVKFKYKVTSVFKVY